MMMMVMSVEIITVIIRLLVTWLLFHLQKLRSLSVLLRMRLMSLLVLWM